MGIVAFISGILALLVVWSNTYWAISLSVVSSLSGIISAFISYEEQLDRLIESFWSKLLFSFIALTSYSIFNPFAEFIIERISLLNSAFFPDAVRLMTIFYTGITWALIFYLVIGYFAVRQIKKLGTKHEENWCLLDSVGRIIGCLATIILFLPAIGSGVFLSKIILEWTSFTQNGLSYTVYSSQYYEMPKECVDAAKKVGFAIDDDYECLFQPDLLCGNLPGNVKVAFLTDGRVAVLGKHKEEGIGKSLKLQIKECSVDQRYQILIKEAGTFPNLGNGSFTKNWELEDDFSKELQSSEKGNPFDKKN